MISVEEAKRRGLAEVNITMTNTQDAQYYASLIIGSNSHTATFIWDTGSSILWVPLANCTGCPSTNKYTTAPSYVSTGVANNITYAQGSVSGILANDQVKLLSTTPAVTMGKISTLSD